MNRLTRVSAEATQVIRSKSFASIKTQFDNIGDALITREMLRLVGRYSELWVDVGRSPAGFVRNLGLYGPDNEAQVVNGALALVAQLLRARIHGIPTFYFLSPGGYHGSLSPMGSFGAAIKYLILVALRMFGVKICHVGVSYERLGRGYALFLSLRSRLLHAHIVRDSQSRKYASSVGMTVHGVAPDLAFGAVGHVEVGGNHSEALELQDSIAFSLRSDQYVGQGREVAELVMSASELLPAAIPFRLVVQVGRDSEEMVALHDQISLSGRTVEVVNVADDLEACFQVYRDCSHVVSNRLHALLVGLLVGATPVALIQPVVNGKIKGLFDCHNLSDSVVDMTNARALAHLMERLERKETISTEAERTVLENLFKKILNPTGNKT